MRRGGQGFAPLLNCTLNSQAAPPLSLFPPPEQACHFPSTALYQPPCLPPSRSSKSWGDRDWRKLWSDLLAVRVGGLSCLDPPDLLAAFIRALLDAGKVALASAFMAGGPEEEGGGLPALPAAVTEPLVLSVAAQLLRTATSLDHAAVGQARSVLTLAPPDAKVGGGGMGPCVRDGS